MTIYHLKDRDGQTLAFVDSTSAKGAIVAHFNDQGGVVEPASKDALYEHLRNVQHQSTRSTLEAVAFDSLPLPLLVPQPQPQP